MADISLTASMRSNLLSLQSTQSLMDVTQERLSTGKKVNSAIDNPSSYYTAQSLSNRANDLSALLDSMGQGIQTIKAADKAIAAITSFAEQAKAIASSARDVPSSLDKSQILSGNFGTTDTVAAAQSFLIDSRADMSTLNVTAAAGPAVAGPISFDLYINGKVENIEVTTTAANETPANVAALVKAKLETMGVGLKVDVGAAGAMTISSTKGDSLSIVNPAADSALAAGGDVATLNTIAAGADVAGVIAGLTKAGVTGVSYQDGVFTVANTSTTNKTAIYNVTAAATKDARFDFSKVMDKKLPANTQRTGYAAQFDAILSQIDSLAKDAGYKGVNLLQENDLKVVFNEDRSSVIDIVGVDASSKGLGISASENTWQSDADIETAINNIDGAITKLRTMAADFGNNYAVVQNREEFTSNLVNVLTEGADKLTLADMNEESANMLALQTRQQLAINSLSLASQAAQSVLKLF